MNQYKWLCLAMVLVGIGILGIHLTLYAPFLFLQTNACRLSVRTVPWIVIMLTVCVLLGTSTALVLAARVLTTSQMETTKKSGWLLLCDAAVLRAIVSCLCPGSASASFYSCARG